MSKYSEFFLNSRSSVVQLECIEISHSAFSKTYRIVRNAVDGVTVTHEDALQYEYEYYPMKVSALTNREDLDFGLEITVGDLGEIIPSEVDAIRAADKFSEKPVLYYRTYRSDDLTDPIYGPVKLEIKEFSFTKEGARFAAAAPSLNINRTGEIYTIDRFPMLRGFL